VSIELTTQMLATLFDFPFEDRRKLTAGRTSPRPQQSGHRPTSEEQCRAAELLANAWLFHAAVERARQRPAAQRPDLDAGAWRATRNMTPQEYLGNLVLLIVGGNDTTRNSMTGGVLALNKMADQWAKLRANPALLDRLVPKSSAGRRRWRTCAAPRCRTTSWAASRSARATRS
jgi:cytochrome P450